MKILIGQSYFRILDPKELKRQMPYPPLGTLYAATILKNAGHEIIFYDAMLSNNPDEFNNLIENLKPDLLLIYDDEFNYLTKMCLSNMREAALSFIRTAKKNNIPAIIYSSDATDFYKYYFDAGCEAIIYGEGEVTVMEVAQSISKGKFVEEREDIAGLKFIANGKLKITPQRKMLDNLDEIPDLDYSIVDIEKYRDIWLKNNGYYSINLSTTRGCPYKCNWCAKPIYGKIYHSRSPQNVANQIKYLKEQLRVDHIWITDDIFGLKPGWIKEFAEELQKLNIKIPYKCLSRPDLLIKDDTLLQLKNSGCVSIWIGAESGSQKILDAMDKGTKISQIYQTADKTHQLGMEIAFFIQFGYLSENLEDIKLTRKMIKECLPDDLGISVSYPLPGTKFYEMVKEQMKYKTNWKDSDDLDMMFSGSFGKPFYKTLHKLVHNEYRLYKILGQNQFKKFPKLIIYFARYLFYTIRLSGYLRTKNNNLTDNLEIYQSI